MSEFEIPDHIKRQIAAQDNTWNALRRSSKIKKVSRIESNSEIPADELPHVIEVVDTGSTTVHKDSKGRKKKTLVRVVQKPGDETTSIEGKEGQTISRKVARRVAPRQVMKEIDNADRRERRKIQKKHHGPVK